MIGWLSRRWVRRALALAPLPLLILWQLSLLRSDLPNTHKMRISGLHSQDRFVYFLFYKNLFPVATLESGRDYYFYYSNDAPPKEPNHLTYSPEAADRSLVEHGDALVQEWGHTMRWGNFLETYLYLFDAWRLGSPELAETRLFNALMFLLALSVVYVAFWACEHTVLGAALFVLVGSDPAQLFAAYREENVKSWPITVACLALALVAPLVTGRRWPTWARAGIACGAGLLCATSYQIRSETAAPLLGVIIVLLTAAGASRRSRLVTAALSLVVFVIGLQAWQAFFSHKIAESTAVVTKAGGHPYPGPWANAHNLWTIVFVGLGDFDTKYGYEASDNSAVAYAEPALRARYGTPLPWWWGMSREHQPRIDADFYDAAHLYYRAPFEAPHVQELLRDKVLHDITHDPKWYAVILAKRTWRILSETTPVQWYARLGTQVRVPFHGLVALLVIVIAAWRREATALRVMAMGAPLSFIALGISTAGNFAYLGIYHLCAAAIVVWWASRFLVARFQAPQHA